MEKIERMSVPKSYMDKPFKGTIENYHFHTFPDGKQIVLGRFVDHPQFAGRMGHTSLVVSIIPTNDPCVTVIETLNSRYRLVWDDPPAEMSPDVFH